MENPFVTVLMPVYNGEKYLAQAIESVLKQTHTHFEFIVINDGSRDRSADIIGSFKDPRIIVVSNPANIGLTASLNLGLQLAKGKYLARMDSDDVSLAERFEKQVNFLEDNPAVAVCGSWIKVFGEGDNRVVKFPTDSDYIRCNLLFRNPIAHPTVMLNLYLLRSAKFFYDNSFETSQDYNLWAKVVESYRVANIPEVLLLLRYHQDQIRTLKIDKQKQFTKKIMRSQLIKIGIIPTKKELDLHSDIGWESLILGKCSIRNARYWFDKLLRKNQQFSIYKESVFNKLLAEKWFSICSVSTELGIWVFIEYLKSSLWRYDNFHIGRLSRFLIDCISR